MRCYIFTTLYPDLIPKVLKVHSQGRNRINWYCNNIVIDQYQYDIATAVNIAIFIAA